MLAKRPTTPLRATWLRATAEPTGFAALTYNPACPEQPASGLLATLDDDALLGVVEAVVWTTLGRVLAGGFRALPSMASLIALANLSRSCKRLRDVVRRVRTCIDALEFQFESVSAIDPDDNEIDQRFELYNLTGGISMPLILPVSSSYRRFNQRVEERHGPSPYQLHIVRDCDPNVSRTNERPYGKPYVFLTIHSYQYTDARTEGVWLNLADGLALFSGVHKRRSIAWKEKLFSPHDLTTGYIPWGTRTASGAPVRYDTRLPTIKVQLQATVHRDGDYIRELFVITTTLGVWDRPCVFNDASREVGNLVPARTIETLEAFFNRCCSTEELAVCRFEGTSRETYRSMLDWCHTHAFAREREALEGDVSLSNVISAEQRRAAVLSADQQIHRMASDRVSHGSDESDDASSDASSVHSDWSEVLDSSSSEGSEDAEDPSDSEASTSEEEAEETTDDED